MILPFIRYFGKRDRVLTLFLQKYRLLRLCRQIFRNKDINGGKQHRKNKQHRTENGYGDFSSYMLHFPPPSDRRR